MKRFLACICACSILVCLGLTACGSQPGAALTVNDSADIGSGIFSYFLNNELYSGAGAYDSDAISASTLDCLAYITVNSECASLGIRLGGTEKAECSLETNALWRLYSDYLTQIGVSKEDFFRIKQYEYLKEALRFALYDRGGYREIPDNDLKAYFNANYAGIKYYYESLYTVLSEDTLASMTQTQRADYAASAAAANERYDTFTKMATLVNSGQFTIDEAYMAATGDVNEGVSVNTTVVGADSTNFSAEFIDAVFSQYEGTTFIVTNADRSYIYFVERVGLFDEGDGLFDQYREECLINYSESFLTNEINTRSAGFKAVRHTDTVDACLERVKSVDRNKYGFSSALGIAEN